MSKITIKKHHKWFGLLFGFFIILFCISGVLLNHRDLISTIDFSRSILPSAYQYKNWNNGLLKGTIKVEDEVYIYGNSGVYVTDSLMSRFEACNDGFPEGVDNRNILKVLQTLDHKLIAVSSSSIYLDFKRSWKSVFNAQERLTDALVCGDSLIVVGRSHLFIAMPPYTEYSVMEVLPSSTSDGKVTLFRTIWLIHSGELFGLVGKLVVDGIAAILIFLTTSGFLYWILPKRIKAINRSGGNSLLAKNSWRWNVRWHRKIGVWTVALTLFSAFTGWCLRPPLLIPLAYTKVPPIPGSILSSDNPWQDKLRALRYDHFNNDWLLSTSDGFYSLVNLESVPKAVSIAPPVSVMGVNIFHQKSSGDWLVGSFSGMYIWKRADSLVLDYFTGDPPLTMQAAPFGNFAASGFTDDVLNSEYVVEYMDGSPDLLMPPSYFSLPISLWNIALEIHTGRVFTFLGMGTLIYISIAGLIVLWVLLSGYLLRKRG